MKHTYRLLACICLFFLSGQLFAQTATEAYRQKAGNFALAYTGIVEKGYRVGYVNTPYYPTEHFRQFCLSRCSLYGCKATQ